MLYARHAGARVWRDYGMLLTLGYWHKRLQQ